MDYQELLNEARYEISETIGRIDTFTKTLKKVQHELEGDMAALTAFLLKIEELENPKLYQPDSMELHKRQVELELERKVSGE